MASAKRHRYSFVCQYSTMHRNTMSQRGTNSHAAQPRHATMVAAFPVTPSGSAIHATAPTENISEISIVMRGTRNRNRMKKKPPMYPCTVQKPMTAPLGRLELLVGIINDIYNYVKCASLGRRRRGVVDEGARQGG